MAATTRRSNPLMMMPMIAGARIPLVPCLELRSKATAPNPKPRGIRQSAPDAMIAMDRRGTIPPLKIKRTSVRLVTTGQIQLRVAAWRANEVCRGSSILVWSNEKAGDGSRQSRTLALKPRGERGVHRIRCMASSSRLFIRHRLTAASVRTPPTPGIRACKRHSARVPRSGWPGLLSRARPRDWRPASGAW